jgi:hypothetical protein
MKKNPQQAIVLLSCLLKILSKQFLQKGDTRMEEKEIVTVASLAITTAIICGVITC